MSESPVDVAVVGAGLIGSAAARHLAEAGASVLLIGPRPGNDQRVHASHDDEARITRRVGPDPVWAALAREAIGRYADIETRSGISFHTPCGHLRLDPSDNRPGSLLSRTREVAAFSGPDIEEWHADQIKRHFPSLAVDRGTVGHWDPAPAGLIHPHRLIRAQHALLRRSGGRVVETVALSIQRRGGGFEVHDHLGTVHRAERVLVAAGSYTARFPLTPEPLALDVRPETVLLANTPDPLRQELGDLPGMIWNFEPVAGAGSAPVDSVYILPPVRYPDGRWYLKVGADHDRDQDVSTREAMHVYMSGQGSASTATALREVIFRLIPPLRDARTRSKPCLLTYSPTGYPMIDEVDSGWFVAVAGCGKSAKSSDQSGKLAADLVSGRSWSGFDRNTFRALRMPSAQG